MVVKSSGIALALLMAAGGAASAQPAFAPRVKQGARVFVIDVGGAERPGRVLAIDAEALELEHASGRLTMPKESIARIEATDAVWNGALIGAAIPLGLYRGSISSFHVLLTGVYGALGALIDAAQHGRHVLYRAHAEAGQPARGPFGPRVKPGARIFVIDWTGAERRGEIFLTGPAGVELDENGRRTTIPTDSIARIEKTDGLLNGALIGAAVSIPLGVASCGEAASKSACYVYGLAASAGIGALIDRARNGRTVLYRGEKPRARQIEWMVAPTRGGFMARVTLNR